ncbi:hypothetical protein DW042_04290 [Bacteroides xylanisolvens]|uniref:Uncharacterized protein n=6 Tax=Bacteroidales TaxID=171549 RepID=A0A642C1I7_BACOV|nr:hypothetical protein F3B52_27510 [Bacteroides ovatus]KAA5476978.1 hypothetical protein F2Y27_17805 [Bacteroides caccae]KAB3840811.1 hypothetical protein GAS47_15040 [Phocaeicola vulgatus]MRX86915.1 hypothetical protein [Parabacteroides merdae]MRY95458.1 hypothetical protein [Parabacteroides distasonis]RHI96685.1 hypothetical protein DW148_13795 [Bacteroides fragilis]RHL00648.1 hypothetical protein DW042_04290 [Bacteroides xylanisolvens]RHL11120.1 hypothetical protein DW036_02905 [Bacteroi
MYYILFFHNYAIFKMIIVFLFEPFRVVLFQFGNQFYVCQSQVCHVGKEENLIIDSFGFLACEAFVFIVETTGLKGIKQGNRADKEFFTLVGFHHTARIVIAAKLYFLCFHTLVILMGYAFHLS